MPDDSDGKESTFKTSDLGSIPVLGISPRGGHGNPLLYFCLEKPMDRGAWRATVHGVMKSCTGLSSIWECEENSRNILFMNIHWSQDSLFKILPLGTFVKNPVGIEEMGDFYLWYTVLVIQHE